MRKLSLLLTKTKIIINNKKTIDIQKILIIWLKTTSVLKLTKMIMKTENINIQNINTIFFFLYFSDTKIKLVPLLTVWYVMILGTLYLHLT